MITEGTVLVILLIIGLIFLKLEYHKILIVLLVIPLVYLSITSQIDITSARGFINGFYIYANWIGRMALSVWDVGTDTVTIVGNAIKGNFTMG